MGSISWITIFSKNITINFSSFCCWDYQAYFLNRRFLKSIPWFVVPVELEIEMNCKVFLIILSFNPKLNRKRPHAIANGLNYKLSWETLCKNAADCWQFHIEELKLWWMDLAAGGPNCTIYTVFHRSALCIHTVLFYYMTSALNLSSWQYLIMMPLQNYC